MNSIESVNGLVSELKEKGTVLSDAVWATALSCVGWPYVFGAEGDECTPEGRKRRASAKYPTIESKCQVLREKDRRQNCDGCQWFPDGKRVRMFDCQGFTEWCLGRFGINIKAAGATSQWNNKKLWRAQGTIDSVPDGILVCLFQAEGNKKIHTGFGFRGETIECQVGVQHCTKRNGKWTHWAIPAGLDGEIPDYKPTLRKGAKGEYVEKLQVRLMELGYELPRFGADGNYGSETIAAVKAFQKEHRLIADGVTGPLTWTALEKTKIKEKLYTVTIRGLTKQQAEDLKRGGYKDFTVNEE